MTRLIDANAFRREIDTYPPFDKETQDSNAMANLAKESLLVALNNMPAIDAIPVSFIEEQVKLCNEIGFRRGEECYMALIEKWRKKNGTETD